MNQNARNPGPVMRKSLCRTKTVMLIPEIKVIFSVDLEGDELPPDPEDCAVLVNVDIGIKGEDGADQFHFTAVTPRFLQRYDDARWGRSYLIVPRFSWETVEAALDKLLLHCRAEDWDTIARNLNKELNWEFENYRPREGAA